MNEPAWARGLSRADRDLVDRLTERVKGHVAGLVREAYQAGKTLIQIKTVLREEKVRFGDYLADVECSPSTARRFIQIALKLSEQFENGQIDRFALSAAELLTARSTPDGALEQACDEAAAGGEITYSRAQEIVEERRVVQEALESLPADQQDEIRQTVRRRMQADGRKDRLRQIESLAGRLRKLAEVEPDIPEESLSYLDAFLAGCRAALAG